MIPNASLVVNWVVGGSALLALFPLVWWHYVYLMHIKKIRDSGRLTRLHRWLTYPLVPTGYVLDVLFNLVWGTVMFLELPRELLFSSRVQRWVDHVDYPGWRGALAYWWAEKMLNPFYEEHIKL